MTSDLTTKLRRAAEFDDVNESDARKHSYALDEQNASSPDYYNDTESIVEGARWQSNRLQPLIEKLIDCVKALEVGDYYNAEIQDVVDSGMRKKVENHEEMLNELQERSSRMMREALTAIQAEVDKLEGR